MSDAPLPPPPAPAPPPPTVSSGSVVSDGAGGYVWKPDPAATYADPPVWNLENGIRRKLTVAEVAALYPTPSLDALKAAQVALLQAAADAAGAAPFAFDFGTAPTVKDDGTAGPAGGVLHLQMADADQENWKAVMPVAIAAIMAQSTSPFPIRVLENVTVQPTPQQVVTCLTAAFGRNSGYVVQTMPKLKLAIAAATTPAAVAAVTWPSP